MPYPTVRIQPGRDKRLRSGSPWLYSNELSMDDTAKSLEPGSIVRVMAGEGRIMGVAHFNPKSLIAARMLTRNKDAAIDAEFFRFRIRRALSLRTRIFDRPFYRLIHAEGDGLPGLVIDRYGDVLVVQFNSAGMERHAALLVEILEELLQPLAILARNDAPVRELEGLDKIFIEAGFEWREPGCSMCLAMNADQLKPGQRCASTSNRNFEGRQGKDGRTHLVGPAMAAAAAIAGHFVDVRDL